MCVACARGDDMVVGVSPSSPLSQRKFKELKGARTWRTWEVNEFVQTGFLITQLADGNILPSLQRAAQKGDHDRRLETCRKKRRAGQWCIGKPGNGTDCSGNIHHILPERGVLWDGDASTAHAVSATPVT